MPPLKPETRWSATLIQTCAFVGCIGSATWVLRGELEAFRVELAAIRDNQARVELFLRNEVVTQRQADRFAASFRWENRALNLSVPDPANYRDRAPNTFKN